MQGRYSPLILRLHISALDKEVSRLKRLLQAVRQLQMP